jgi:TonB family protein
MLPGSQKRKTKNSSKVNLLISLTFHGILVLAVLYFAARQGWMGKTMNKIAVEIVHEQKPKVPEKPKEPPKPKVEEAKVDEQKPVQVAKLETPRNIAPPPPASMASEAIAPPPVEIPSFDFEGGKVVAFSSDRVQQYKGLLQEAVQGNWDRPRDVDDHTNVAEVEIAVDKTGQITNLGMKKKSGQKKWDDSVLLAIANTKKVSLPPPTNFPPRVVIRFDVAASSPLGQ